MGTRTWRFVACAPERVSAVCPLMGVRTVGTCASTSATTSRSSGVSPQTCCSRSGKSLFRRKSISSQETSAAQLGIPKETFRPPYFPQHTHAVSSRRHPLVGPQVYPWEVYRLLWFLEGSRDREGVAHKNFPAKPNRRPRHEFRGTWAKTQRPNTQPLSWFSALQRGQESPRWCLAQQRSSRSYQLGVLHLSPRCATSVSSWCFHLDCLSGGGWCDLMRQLRVSR